MNILENIIAYKKDEVAARKILVPLQELENSALMSRVCLSLKANLLATRSTGIIAEFKRKSPSKGIINNKANVLEVTSGYARHGAAGISVLTDNHFFGGSTEDIVKARVNEIPILRKEFIIDEYQVYASKVMGADVILLIAACLDKHSVKKLALLAKSLGMEVLLEVHDEAETGHFCEGIDMIGINNRNLKTFEVNLAHSIELAGKLDKQILKISESGINHARTVKDLKQAGFQGFLVGEQFMQSGDPVEAFREFVKDVKELSDK